ncbi:Glycerol-3-phosphate dehydrogenase [NAD(P)+] [compost metagenome]
MEGVRTTKAARELSAQFGVVMPITEQLHKVLFEDQSPRIAVEDLMGRGRTHEMEEISEDWGLHH